jgi:putative DNA methylase
MTQITKIGKKLIEVALPLEAINEEGSRRKRKAPAGYPTTLHKWWAQRPVAAARGVIFAQMVDDPSAYVDTLLGEPTTKRTAQRELKKRLELWEKRKATFTASIGSQGVTAPEPGTKPTLEEAAADIERERLFKIIEELVKWENTKDEGVLERARAEIWQSWRRACAANASHPRAKELFNRSSLPPFHDPFAGSGALPLEAQRLGLEAYASDLNPVAVLINKAMIEIPPKFADRPPVNPASRADGTFDLHRWHGSQGLANDVRYYGKWIRDEAEKRIGALYPKLEITAEMAKGRSDLTPLVGRKLQIIAWLWARTVKSPNPAFRNVDVPLASTFLLSTNSGKEVYVEPIVKGDSYNFVVKLGKPKNPNVTKVGTKLARGANFRCVVSGAAIEGDYIKAEGRAGRMNSRLMAIVAQGDRGRIYLSPTAEQEAIALQAKPDWIPDTPIGNDPRALWTLPYGLTAFSHLFTARQLVALNAFVELMPSARSQAREDALALAAANHKEVTSEHRADAQAYADAVCTYLALAIGRAADYGSSIATWRPKDNAMRSTMPKQGIQMAWDYAEGSPFGASSAGFSECVNVVAKVIETALYKGRGKAFQIDVQSVSLAERGCAVVSTDPPYYDNIGYADLSDFFYVWLRQSLRGIFPELFTTINTPKAEELVATPYRFGSKERAEVFFLDGMTQAMHRLAEQTHPAFPVTIYYAYKQSESDGEEVAGRTGWETFLDAVIRAGFAISGTWPIRTEGDNRQVGIGANALASSIVLVCRPRPTDAPIATRREFLSELKVQLPAALFHLQRSNIAPVDLAQAAIGPGMAIFTRYAKVMDAEGKSDTVGEALSLINQVLDEVLAEQEGDFDSDSRFAIAWFEQMGFEEGPFGVADVLARAKNTAVASVADAGILVSKAGKVRLMKPAELDSDWEPIADKRLTVWEMVHHLVRALEASGEAASGKLLAKLGSKAEVARELAYRLYTVCERKKRAQEALSYNALVQSWSEISRLAREDVVMVEPDELSQSEMFGRT